MPCDYGNSCGADFGGVYDEVRRFDKAVEPYRFRLNRHSRASGNPEPPFRRVPLDPRFRGGDEGVSFQSDCV